MKKVKGVWIGEERVTVEAGRVKTGQSVEFPKATADSFENQGLFQPIKKGGSK